MCRGLTSPSTDADSDAGPHHKDAGAESCPRHRPAAAPAHRRYGNHSYHQTRLTERPHQPPGGRQADQSELGAHAAGVQERHGGKCAVGAICSSSGDASDRRPLTRLRALSHDSVSLKALERAVAAASSISLWGSVPLTEAHDCKKNTSRHD